MNRDFCMVGSCRELLIVTWEGVAINVFWVQGPGRGICCQYVSPPQYGKGSITLDQLCEYMYKTVIDGHLTKVLYVRL